MAVSLYSTSQNESLCITISCSTFYYNFVFITVTNNDIRVIKGAHFRFTYRPLGVPSVPSYEVMVGYYELNIKEETTIQLK